MPLASTLAAAKLAAAIEKRHSVRKYQTQPLPKEIIDQVIQGGRNAVPLYANIDIRWYIVWNGSVIARRLSGLAGISGMFTTAPHYIIAVSQDRPGYMENMGFCMEQLILTATSLGLGTCWIGGIFGQEQLLDLVPDLGRDERIIALTPLGYPDNSASAKLVGRLTRWGTNLLGKRKAIAEIVSQDIWSVPWSNPDPRWNQIFEYTRRAPSWANTQPWHFVVSGSTVIAAVYNTPQKGNVREGKPYYRLDGGIAMCHFYLAAQAEGLNARWMPVQNADALRTRYAIPNDHDLVGVWNEDAS